MTTRIGFIGIGMMGHGMAKNLLAKGYAVTVVAHRNRGPVEDLVGQGATEAATPRAAAEASDMIIICVTGAPQVEAVVYGDDGILAGVRDGMTVIDCSTSLPGTTDRVAADLDAKGCALADAPLARTPVEAEEGRLNTMVGGTPDTFTEIEPVLACFCENIFHVGGVGAGHKTKLIYNFMAMGIAALTAEALAACAATDVDHQEFYDVVSAGGANSGIFQLIVPRALEAGDLSGLQFSLANAEKDLGYFTRMTDAAALGGDLGKAVHAALARGLKLEAEDALVGDLIGAQAKLNDLEILSPVPAAKVA